jgi:hypothetical protein
MHPASEFSRFPKFLIADDGDERFFVVHCHSPRFIMEFSDDQEAVPVWIDDPNALDAAAGDKLMTEAGDFFATQIDRE